MVNDLKTVMVFGTFDGLHKGHIHFLMQAKDYGDELIVVVARDKTVKKIKGKLPRLKEEERQKEIIKSKLTEKVTLGRLNNKYKLIKYYKPDVICLGYDQSCFTENLSEKLKALGLLNTKIVRLKAYKPEKYKSSLL
ncbi:adenylyltransferase/cytidyltransferase family protein [Candidatus Falkowbacteria bacterium]|jgi:FAD synthetase|nr:adenylyltransferase/cytidyltransferase family protein [Candidatus Falkowbacteria bacterium]MBT4433111.1 adenylyltransferase/cytidyltransferase family protein [Candidatus Falkowbacteria bacterium]